LKFTEEGGITVRIGCEPLDEPVEKVGESPGDTILLRFEVADTGAGIAEEDLDGLFEAFTQTASGRASQEGTGLGLPISRRFVELMGGEMTVQSEVDKGSVFKFTVRAHPAGAEDVVATGVTRRVIRVAPGQPEFRILVVEDRVENRRLLTRLLLSVGFEVRDAANGAQALERWEQWNPDFIWMDMRMPVMDGYEATRRIKESKKGQTTAVVALTASAFEEEQASILEAGCDDLVRKPFREAEVFEAMTRHLGVEYEYEGAEEEGVQLDPSGSVSAGLARQDELWISKLRDASTQADASQVITLAAKIAEDDPELASYLVKLTEDFNFHVILNMLDS
jgi:CheY-like chemotaxis protein